MILVFQLEISKVLDARDQVHAHQSYDQTNVTNLKRQASIKINIKPMKASLITFTTI
jgi:hypothetical protein